MLKLIVAILTGKIIFFLSRIFKIGGGSAAPGLYALKVEPNLVSLLSAQIPKKIIITGTNGKTTTARLLDHLVKSQNLKTIRNSTGSNLERGIASALIAKSNLFGKIKDVDLGIFEVDEAAFNKIVFKIKPEFIVFLNAFRDQLDRYGEVDAVVKNWKDALGKIDWEPTVLMNISDENTSWIKDIPSLKVYGFGVLGHKVIDVEGLEEDKKPKKGAEFEAKILKNLGLEGTELKISYPKGKLDLEFKVPGIYHLYDLLAAFSVYYSLGMPAEEVDRFLKGYTPAFGRVEKVQISGKTLYILLIKNPAGANSVLETISPEIKDSDRLLIALNDNFADGTDVSWIWDVNFEMLSKTSPEKIFSSGQRAKDMAVRLKYAGVAEGKIKVEEGLDKALLGSLENLEGRVFILPTYTALLELQKILAKNKVKSDYWKEA